MVDGNLVVGSENDDAAALFGGQLVDLGALEEDFAGISKLVQAAVGDHRLDIALAGAKGFADLIQRHVFIGHDKSSSAEVNSLSPPPGGVESWCGGRPWSALRFAGGRLIL